MNKQNYYKMIKLAEAVNEEDSRKVSEDKEDKLLRSERLNNNKFREQLLGGLSSSLMIAALGAILGGVAGAGTTPRIGVPRSHNALAGAAVGGSLGFQLGAASQAVGALAGAIKGPRSLTEQTKYDKDDTSVSNYLIPGVAGYRRARSYLTNDEERAIMRELMIDKMKQKKGIA